MLRVKRIAFLLCCCLVLALTGPVRSNEDEKYYELQTINIQLVDREGRSLSVPEGTHINLVLAAKNNVFSNGSDVIDLPGFNYKLNDPLPVDLDAGGKGRLDVPAPKTNNLEVEYEIQLDEKLSGTFGSLEDKRISLIPHCQDTTYRIRLANVKRPAWEYAALICGGIIMLLLSYALSQIIANRSAEESQGRIRLICLVLFGVLSLAMTLLAFLYPGVAGAVPYLSMSLFLLVPILLLFCACRIVNNMSSEY